jgi:hypothetical protein
VLAAFLSNDTERISDILGHDKGDLKIEITLSSRASPRGNTSRIVYQSGLIEETMAPIPVLAIPDVRWLDRTTSSFSREDKEPDDLARYGYRHFLYDLPISGLIQTTLSQACIDALPSRSFLLSPRRLKTVPILGLIETTITALSGSGFSFHRIEPTGSAGRFSIDVITEAQPDPVPLQLVSQGTLSVVAIVVLIYNYLRVIARANGISSPQQAPGLVIIDELDAHLHPAWQSSIVDLLRESFPNIQFVCAAHSPLVVAGSLENEVGVLRRGETGKFSMQNIASDFVGWKAEDILRRVFDVEDQNPTFHRYVAMAPRRDALMEEARQLSAGKNLPVLDEIRLQRLLRDIHYIDMAREMQKQQSQTEFFLARARQMKDRADDPDTERTLNM